MTCCTVLVLHNPAARDGAASSDELVLRANFLRCEPLSDQPLAAELLLLRVCFYSGCGYRYKVASYGDRVLDSSVSGFGSKI